MYVDPDLKSRVEGAFRPLQDRASGKLPASGYLSDTLKGHFSKSKKKTASAEVFLSREEATAFTTASVDMWLRGVHSYLLSCGAAESSPLWASVAGYYASHYAVRAFAHLLGHFQLMSIGKVVIADVPTTAARCKAMQKTQSEREHRYYWKVVKKCPQFAGDDFFTANVEYGGACDAMHRERGQYVDHMGGFAPFAPMKEDALKKQLSRIAGAAIDAAPIPRPAKYPDVVSVQIVAYHRLLRYRQVVDECAGPNHRFWKVHRTPSWARDVITFFDSDKSALKASLEEASRAALEAGV